MSRRGWGDVRLRESAELSAQGCWSAVEGMRDNGDALGYVRDNSRRLPWPHHISGTVGSIDVRLRGFNRLGWGMVDGDKVNCWWVNFSELKKMFFWSKELGHTAGSWLVAMPGAWPELFFYLFLPPVWTHWAAFYCILSFFFLCRSARSVASYFVFFLFWLASAVKTYMRCDKWDNWLHKVRILTKLDYFIRRSTLMDFWHRLAGFIQASCHA